MRGLRRFLIIAAVLAGAMLTAKPSQAYYRQYYSSWSYRPTHSYHYRTYYYKPYANYDSYNYHYCVHYPSQPRYVYYYNPHNRQYWGRFDTEGQDGAQYSILAENDRKEHLSDIPESAFPKPGAMPVIPDSKDGVQLEVPGDVPGKDVPDDKPAGN